MLGFGPREQQPVLRILRLRPLNEYTVLPALAGFASGFRGNSSMQGQKIKAIGLTRRRLGLVLLAGGLLLTGCGGGGSGSDINLGPLPTPGGGGNGGGNTGDEFDASTATLTLEGPTAVSPSSSTEFLATLVDENGTAPPNSGLFVSIQPTQGVISPPGGANTDALGQVSFTYDSPNTQSPRTERITARVNQGGVSLTQRLDVRVTPDIFQFTSPADDATIDPTPPAGALLEFQWVVAGMPVNTGQTPPAGGASQVMLSFDSSDGAQGAFTVDGSGPSNPVMVDIADGDFADAVAVLNNGQPGNATITAVADGGFTTELNLRYTGFAADVDLTADPVNIGTTGASNLAAVVRDSAGNPKSSLAVRLSIETCASGAAPPCANGETLQGDSPQGPMSGDEVLLNTNVNGQVQAIYRAGTGAGGAIIRATVEQGTAPGASVTDTVAINVNASP